MDLLARAIARKVHEHLTKSAMNLPNEAAELRAVFNGPPSEILQIVFEELTTSGGIPVTLSDGNEVKVPVVLQIAELPPGVANPLIGTSGICEPNYLLHLRNSPLTPRFLGLVPPAQHPNLSQSSTREEFGVNSRNNSGSATVSNWWNDEFIQSLVLEAIEEARVEDGQREQAHKLIRFAIQAAHEADVHDFDRTNSWAVLARLWTLANRNDLSPADRISLACGVPSPSDGRLDADAQIKILRDLATRLERGIRAGIDELKADSEPEVVSALEEVRAQVSERCEVPTSLERAMQFFYTPTLTKDGGAPAWWLFLTTARWTAILNDDVVPIGEIQLECVNPLRLHGRNAMPVTSENVCLRLKIPAEVENGTIVTVRRNARNKATVHEWTFEHQQGVDIEFIDNRIPEHKTPLIYTAEAGQAKTGSLKVICLNYWACGFVIFSRNASKTTVPKQAKSTAGRSRFDVSITLHGEGRHYVDILVRPDFTTSREATPLTDSGKPDITEAAPIFEVSSSERGAELLALNGRQYEFQVSSQIGGQITARLTLSCEEMSPETCTSEFERLIRLNRRDARKGPTEVHLDRQARASDLQSWLLSELRVARSFYPFVLAPDYATEWRARSWSTAEDTVFSKGSFVQDPRPLYNEMLPPEEFIAARLILAARLRGVDGDGLVESAKLGEWMCIDPSFAATVEQYVRSYELWLSEAPEVASWCDIGAVCRLEADGSTLSQEPDALLVSPLHPVRLGWHCLAQKALFIAQRNQPCPAASILDPDCVPDSIVVPLRTPSGETRSQAFLSVECSSDYWAVLWNGSSSKLGTLGAFSVQAPFDDQFGITVGGVSSGFSVSQVQRSLTDLSEMLGAKPVMNVLISSASGRNNSCTEGVIAWCKQNFAISESDGLSRPSTGPQIIQVIDERPAIFRPEDAAISDLAEDTGNRVRWHSSADLVVPDLGIVAQLELSNLEAAIVPNTSPMSRGGLVRTRLRDQWKVARGVVLTETRSGDEALPDVDEFANAVSAALARLEHQANTPYGYQFAPSPHAIDSVLAKSDFAAVSSSTVDPACFLGGWLDKAYLWDYALPSYSNRAEDTNGYYLLSSIRESSYEPLARALRKLPGCENLTDTDTQGILLEVSRRGVPTVRGMSGANSSAAGDLGMFVASRLLQDEFRSAPHGQGILPIRAGEGTHTVYLVVPVDPFKGYLEDLSRALVKAVPKQRPDLLVLAVTYDGNDIRLKLTPIEVKYRSSSELGSAAVDALSQARALSTTLTKMLEFSNSSGLTLWKLASQQLLIAIANFGFRVYGQQINSMNGGPSWQHLHKSLIQSIYNETAAIEIDRCGRVIATDTSRMSVLRDNDGDGFCESLYLSHADAGKIVCSNYGEQMAALRGKIGTWDLAPKLNGEGQIDHVTNIQSQDGPAVPDNTTQVPEALLPLYENNNGVKILLGDSVDALTKHTRYLDLSDTNLNQMNIGIVGDLGTGKTQLLKSIVAQLAHAKEHNAGVRPSILIFDYKKDYISEDFVRSTNAKVVTPQNLPLNLFSLKGANSTLNPIADRIRFFTDVLDKIYSGIGAVQRSNLRSAIKKAYEDAGALGNEPTIYDVQDAYMAISGRPDTITSILDHIADMRLFSDKPEPDATFEKFLDGVVVISLNQLGQDDNSKNMVVAILLNMFYERMLRLPKRPYFGTSPQRRIIDSFLLVDEADKIMKFNFDVLKTLLLEGREFGVGIILASQYLSHFKVGSMDYKEPLLTWCIHKVPNVTSQELATLGYASKSVQVAERVKSLALHECLYKSFDVHGDVIKAVPFYQLHLHNKP